MSLCTEKSVNLKIDVIDQSRSMKRDYGRISEAERRGLLSFTLQGLTLEHKYCLHFHQTVPNKAEESQLTMSAGWVKYYEA